MSAVKGGLTQSNSPPLAPTSRIPESPSRDVWEERWKHQWDRSWAWFDTGKVQDVPISQDEMRGISRPGQDLHPLVKRGGTD
jgi:hypothetical protein